MRFSKYFMTIFVICLLTYCSKAVKKPDVIQIVTSADYEPFSYRNEKGEPIGFEVDLVKEIMTRLDKPYKIEDLNFNEIFNALEAKRVDMAISSIGVTPDRQEKFDFSIPYINSPKSLILSVDNTATTLDDLNPKNILIQTGSVHPTILKQFLVKYPNINIVDLRDVDAIMQEFKKDFNKNTIIILDRAVANNLFKKDPDLKIRTMDFQEEDFDLAITMPKGSKWKRAINHILQKMKKDGSLEALKKKYKL